MKGAIMQPYLFPYIGYYQLMNYVDVFIYLNDVSYIKKGFINKNEILVFSKKQKFILPVKSASQNKNICDLYFDTENKLYSKTLKTIKLAYQNAPFHNIIKELLELLEEKLDLTIDNYITIINSKIIEYLDLNTIIKESKSFNSILSGEEKIIELCRINNIKNYINPIGGINLYTKASFIRNNITLNFLKKNKIFYSQTKNPSFEFIDNLSILDILARCSPAVIKNELFKEFEIL